MERKNSVSVVIPVFNAGDYLLEAVDSALSQQGDFQLDAVILIDDGSTDSRTREILSDISGREQVVVLKNQRKKGSAGARNEGILHAQSDWIIFIDADDVMLPGSLSARFEAVQRYPQAEWVGADFMLCSEEGVPDGVRFFHSKPQVAQYVYAGSEGVTLLSKPATAFIKHNLASCTILVRRDLLIRAGLFDEKLRKAQDYHLFIRLAQLSDYLFVQQSLALYRMHSGSVTASGAPREWASLAFEELSAREGWTVEQQRLFKIRQAGFVQEDMTYYRGIKDLKGLYSLRERVRRYAPFQAGLQTFYFKSLIVTLIKKYIS